MSPHRRVTSEKMAFTLPMTPKSAFLPVQPAVQESRILPILRERLTNNQDQYLESCRSRRLVVHISYYKALRGVESTHASRPRWGHRNCISHHRSRMATRCRWRMISLLSLQPPSGIGRHGDRPIQWVPRTNYKNPVLQQH